MSVDEFPRLHVSDQLPETDKDVTREAAVSEKVADVDAARTDTSTSVRGGEWSCGAVPTCCRHLWFLL